MTHIPTPSPSGERPPPRPGAPTWPGHVCIAVLALLCAGMASDGWHGKLGPARWRGSLVYVPSSNTPVTFQGRVTARLNAGSLWRVGEASLGRLWFNSGSLKGWVRASDVVPLDRAVAQFAGRIAASPFDSDAWVGRGVARLALKEYSRAIDDFNEAIRLNPRASWAYHHRSAARRSLRDFQGAFADANYAVYLNPGEPSHLADRAAARVGLGDHAGAIEDYNGAIARLGGREASVEGPEQVGPGHARLLAVRWTCARAECWEALRKSEKAVADLTEALRLDPSDVSTLNATALALATAEGPPVRDGRRAFELAARACDLTGYRNHAYLGTLAAAFAANGDRSGAVHWLRRAIELAGGDERLTAAYRERLARLEREPAR